MESDPGKMTWGDVAEFVQQAHLGRSEYFSTRDVFTSGVAREEIWSKGYPCAYWMAGGSEGWYVHVARNYRVSGKPVHEDLMVGKFWSAQNAAFAVDLITRYMNGVFKSIDELVEEGRVRAWG